MVKHCVLAYHQQTNNNDILVLGKLAMDVETDWSTTTCTPSSAVFTATNILGAKLRMHYETHPYSGCSALKWQLLCLHCRNQGTFQLERATIRFDR